jgi:hypothetical protein
LPWNSSLSKVENREMEGEDVLLSIPCDIIMLSLPFSISVNSSAFSRLESI